MNDLPTQRQLEDYVRGHPDVTLLELRNAFFQRGDITPVMDDEPLLPAGVKKVFLFDTNREFWLFLQEFIRREDVEVKVNPLAHLISDNESYVGRHAFVPVTLRMKA